MASKNNVTLTFAGDSEQLEKAFGRVGDSADDMQKQVKDTGAGFDRAAEGFDTLDTRSMGFRDTLTGVQDSMAGVGALARGDLFEGLFTLGMGVGDLASGFANFLVPGLKSAVTWLGQTRVGTLAVAGAQRVAAAASVVWAGAQRVLNAVMRANPILKVVALIGALVGAIAWIANRVGGFGNLWRIVMNAVVSAARWVWRNVTSVFSSIAGFIGGIARRIGGFFSGLWSGMVSGLKSAANWIIGILNGIIDGINWVIRQVNVLPGVDIGQIGHIPKFHDGGVVPGAPGTEVLAMLQAGETVTPAGQSARTPRTVHVDLGPELMAMIRRQVRAEGGSVQFVLGAG